MKLYSKLTTTFLLLLLASCAATSGAPNPGAPTLGNTSFKEVLPLRVGWVRTLFDVSDEDTWRPVQYAAPEVADGVVYLGNTKNEFHAFDAESGNTLWISNTYGPVECRATVLDQVVIFGDGDGYVYCLDKTNGFVKWTYKVQGQVMGSIVTDGELVFVHTNHERLYALDVKDGRWKWMQQRNLPAGFTVKGECSPVLDGDRVLLGYADGYLFAYNAKTGQEVYKTMLEEGERFYDVDATPVVDGQSIYVASFGGTFFCLSRENASIQWTLNSLGSVQSASVVGDFLFIADAAGFIRAVDKRNGIEQWSFDLRENDLKNSLAPKPRRKLKSPTNPVPFGEVLIVGSSSGYLYGLDLQTGKQRWSFWPGYGVTAELVKNEEETALYMHTNYGNLYCLKPNFPTR